MLRLSYLSHRIFRQPYYRELCSKNKSNDLFLHISPCGDWWNGSEVFAAKHLQPDYVRSIPIPNEMILNFEESLNDYDGEDLDELMKKIYDDGEISILRPIIEKNQNKS